MVRRKKAGQGGLLRLRRRGRSSRGKCYVLRILGPGFAMDRKGRDTLQERLEEAAVTVKATRTATRNKNKFNIPVEIRKMATGAAKCRNLVLRKELRKKARKARREFDGRVGALPRGKTIQSPVVQ